LCRSTELDVSRDAAGFTLLEVLVALAVLSTSLAAIGSLVAHNIRTTRAVDEKVALVETTRSILTGLPDRAQIVPGHLAGEVADYRWQIDIARLGVPDTDPQQVPPWVPETVVVRVQALSGQMLRVDTVRLHRQQGSPK
jgi:general secretion pathway protein I